jgi:hypothetical protein
MVKEGSTDASQSSGRWWLLVVAVFIELTEKRLAGLVGWLFFHFYFWLLDLQILHKRSFLWATLLRIRSLRY